MEGIDSVTLTCASSANPEAELAWRKEGGGRVLGNFPTLDIGVVSRTDMGTYTCSSYRGICFAITKCRYKRSYIKAIDYSRRTRGRYAVISADNLN